jgi:hypothetical protein
MGDVFEFVIKVAVFVGVALYMWSVSSSLESLARDVKRLADRTGPKEPVGDSDQIIGV